MSPDEYLKNRLDDQISWMDAKAIQNQSYYTRLTLTQIGTASAVPVLVGLDATRFTWAPIATGVLGATVALLAGVVAVMRYQAKWIEYRTACEALKREKYMFLARVPPYNGDDAFAQLVTRAEATLSKENAAWAQHMLTPSLAAK